MPWLLAADPSGAADLVVLQGLVLDVGAGTLAVYANGSRLGNMVQPGIEGVAPLRPPLRWAVQLSSGMEVAMDGPQPIPTG